MNKVTRRGLILAGVGGVAGAAAASRLIRQYGLLPPDSGGLYGPGHTLTYASHRLITRHSLAREFSRSQISAKPFANGRPPKSEDYIAHQKAGFTDWRLQIDGMVSNPGSFSVADLRAMPASGQITQLICEEGWSYIAEWTGVPLNHLLGLAGAAPQARYVIYSSIQPGWRSAIDMADALHPQTVIAYAMNDADVPAGHGGPLRMRVPRQLGYRSVKYLTRLTVTDSLDGKLRKSSYSWHAGI